MKALIELHFQHERFIENVLRSTLSYPNEASKECIQFLNVVRLYLFVHHYVVRLYRHYRRFWQEKLSANHHYGIKYAIAKAVCTKT